MEENKELTIREIVEMLSNLPGVNKEYFSQSIAKHFSTLEAMKEDLPEVINIYNEYDIPYIKNETGIINFLALARSKEEALEYANKNNDVISIEDMTNNRKVA